MFFVLVHSPLIAANVAWRHINVEGTTVINRETGEEGSGLVLEWRTGDSDLPWQASFSIGIHAREAGFRMFVSPALWTMWLTDASYWSVGTRGDVITADYVRNGTLFYDGWNGANNGERYGDAAMIVGSKLFYLAFIAPTYDGSGDTLYGWVELLNEDGELQLYSSAFSNTPLYVGGGAVPVADVPEPSTAILLLLGASCLALRRKYLFSKRRYPCS